MTKGIRSILLATVGSLLLAGPALAADWPRRIVGTWDIQANQTAGTLVITSQGRGEGCVPIAGTIYTTDVIQGFYCRISGRISFLAKTSSNVTFQVYTGNLSQQSRGLPLWMGGTFASEEYSLGGELGEYSFFAKRR